MFFLLTYPSKVISYQLIKKQFETGAISQEEVTQAISRQYIRALQIITERRDRGLSYGNGVQNMDPFALFRDAPELTQKLGNLDVKTLKNQAPMEGTLLFIRQQETGHFKASLTKTG